MQATQYDYIFLGAGCSSLSIIMRMINSTSFVDKKILIIDKESKTKNDRTWCFWERENGFFESIVFRKWDHLFFMSDFKLDVDSPYPIPEKETYKQKPDPLPYPKRYPKFSHLGKNLEIVIDKALKEEDPEKKAGFANSIAYYMKLAYSNWHKELVHDDAIRSELNNITGGELEFSATPFIKHRPPAFDATEANSLQSSFP